MARRQPTSVRFSDEDVELIERLMKHYGVASVTTLLQMSLRALARETGINPSAAPPSRQTPTQG